LRQNTLRSPYSIATPVFNCPYSVAIECPFNCDTTQNAEPKTNLVNRIIGCFPRAILHSPLVRHAQGEVTPALLEHLSPGSHHILCSTGCHVHRLLPNPNNINKSAGRGKNKPPNPKVRSPNPKVRSFSGNPTFASFCSCALSTLGLPSAMHWASRASLRFASLSATSSRCSNSSIALMICKNRSNR
jgi:hypothetical protein